MEKLVIKKRVGEELAYWKVNCEGAYPNTVVESDMGITVIVNVDGERKITTQKKFTLNSLFNPGHNTKLIGGKKPYKSIEIYAIDMNSEFKSEWGLAGFSALPCYDAEFGVEAKAVAFGEFFYNIDDFFSFLRWLPMGDKEAISRDDIREFLRSQTSGVVRNHLSALLANKDIKVCQSKLVDIAEDVKYELNKMFDSKGITVQSFNVTVLDYEPAHKANRATLNAAKMDNKVRSVVNEGRRDDLTVDKAQSEIDIDYINALNGGKQSERKEESKIRCPRCGEPNDASINYCYKCGESLHKKN
ncbi:MAG: SPFH domain-containing protein [Clostridia bacterium]|nr:SPFH domain-containing protein [Clostridia bacterium]